MLQMELKWRMMVIVVHRLYKTSNTRLKFNKIIVDQ